MLEIAKAKGKLAAQYKFKKGDKIIYKNYSTTDVKIDDKDYIIVKEEDVLATL